MNKYHPRPTSSVGRVLAFFAHNPDEELTRADVAVKFDIAPTSVVGTLRAAVEAGLISESRTAKGQLVYRAGQLTTTTTTQEARHG